METDKNLQGMLAWWKQVAPQSGVDKGPVNEATLHGARMALKWTAVVPAAMAVGYLILIAWFRANGGYRQKRIEEA